MFLKNASAKTRKNTIHNMVTEICESSGTSVREHSFTHSLCRGANEMIVSINVYPMANMKRFGSDL